MSSKQLSIEDLTELIKNIKIENNDLENIDNLQNKKDFQLNLTNKDFNLNTRDCNTSKSIMALTLTIDPLKYLEKLPEFSGDYRDLENFTNLITKIYPTLSRYDALSQSIFSDVIKSKLRGRAREVIEINNHITTWVEIKNILINNFGDRSSVEELFDQLRGATFKTNCADFYSDIKIVLRRLNVKSKLASGDDVALATQTITNNKTSALTIFKNKIPEPMRSVLYCRNPTTLENAMDILHESGYAYSNVSSHKPVNAYPRNNNGNNNFYKNNNNNSTNNNFSNNNNRPSNDKQYNNNYRSPVNGNQNNRNNTYQNQRYERPNLNFRTQNSFPQHNNNVTNRNSFQYRNQQIQENPIRNPQYGNPNNLRQNYQLPPPEPMDVNTNQLKQIQEPQPQPQPENFPSPASPTNYPI